MSERLTEAERRKWVEDTAEFAWAFGLAEKLWEKLGLIIEARSKR